MWTTITSRRKLKSCGLVVACIPKGRVALVHGASVKVDLVLGVMMARFLKVVAREAAAQPEIQRLVGQAASKL